MSTSFAGKPKVIALQTNEREMVGTTIEEFVNGFVSILNSETRETVADNLRCEIFFLNKTLFAKNVAVHRMLMKRTIKCTIFHLFYAAFQLDDSHLEC